MRGCTGKCFIHFYVMPLSIKDGLFPRGGIYSKYLEAHESLWRELSVAMLLVSHAIRPNIGISYALSRWEGIAVLLAEAPRLRINALAHLF